MKITLFFCSFFVFQLKAGTVFSQNTTVNLRSNTLTVGKLISEIERQTDYLFIYKKNDVDTAQKITVSAGSKSVSDILASAFGQSNIGYKFSHNYISLYTKSTDEVGSVQQSTKKTITGKITDSKDEPVIGVNILEKGTANGTITDTDGNFSLNVSDNAVLIVSYIGYTTVRVNRLKLHHLGLLRLKQWTCQGYSK